MSTTVDDGRLLVQIASYNSNSQSIDALPQDLVDWLAPTLQVSSFLSNQRRAPDIVAVGFQELLPLHLGRARRRYLQAVAGFSRSVLEQRNALVRSQIETHAPNREKYSLIAKVVNVGVALLVYGRDDGIARLVGDVQTQWTGCGPAYMGNKGAVGIRFRVGSANGGPGEIYTFVCAHLTAFEDRLAQRIADFHHIVGTLLFPPVLSEFNELGTIYKTSHLFFLGDLNFRLDLPSSHPLYSFRYRPEFARALDNEDTRKELKEFDQLYVQRVKGSAFVGLREGDFWRFKCSYKYQLGEVDKYNNHKRVPAWTDRVLYTTYTDPPDGLDESNITNILYTSIPSYTTSDHKPITSLLLLPPTPQTDEFLDKPPLIRLPSAYVPKPDPLATFKRYAGRTLDRIVGVLWCILVILGAGSSLVGIVNLCLGIAAWFWWRSKSPGNLGRIFGWII